MPLSESTAAAAVMAVLSAGDYGGALTGPATAQLQAIADAFAKCIPHFVTNNTVSTTVTGAVAGAVTGPPPTLGVFTGTGTGSIGGLVKGSASGGTGLAGEIMAALQSASYGGALDGVATSQLALLADACAVYADHVQANATVSTNVTGPSTTPGVNGPSTGTGGGNAV